MRRTVIIVFFLVIGSIIADAQLPCEMDSAMEDSVYIYKDGHSDEYKLIYRGGAYFLEYTPRPIEMLSTDKLKTFTVNIARSLYEHTSWHLRKLAAAHEWLIPAKLTGASAIYLPGSSNGYFLHRDARVKKQTDSIFQWLGSESITFDIGNTDNRSFTGRIITRKFINKAGVVTGYDEYFFKPNPFYGFISQDTSTYYIHVAKGKYPPDALQKLAGKELIITAAIQQGNIPIPGGRNGPEGRGGIYLSILKIEQMHND